MANANFAELLRRGIAPQDGQTVRFTTSTSISRDIEAHGVNGFFRDGRFWSVDMADHWSPNEVTNWSPA